MNNMPAKMTGVYQLKNGKYAYRLKLKINGKPIDTDRSLDEHGKPFLTKTDAYQAKLRHEQQLRAGQTPTVRGKHTVTEVYETFLSSGLAQSKAPATIRKHISIWENHFRDAFGDRYIDEITIGELDDYLHGIYSKLSYRFTESHYKLILLLWGYADRLEWIPTERYHRMMVNRGTKLKMPPKKQCDVEDDLRGAVVYSDEDLREMMYCLRRGEAHLLTAFMLSLYTGVRIGENFALRWSDIDWEDRSISVSRSMQYVDGKIKLEPVKTMKSIRKVPLPDVLRDHLLNKLEQQTADRERMGRAYKATEQVFDEVSQQWLVGADFISRKRDGSLLTINSVKYWAKQVRELTGIELKMHWLRHTFATACAASNIPLTVLQEWMGHKKISTTQCYYINLADNRAVYDRALATVEKMYDLDLQKTRTVPAPPLTPTQQRLQAIEQRQHILLVQELMRRDQESNNEDN